MVSDEGISYEARKTLNPQGPVAQKGIIKEVCECVQGGISHSDMPICIDISTPWGVPHLSWDKCFIGECDGLNVPHQSNAFGVFNFPGVINRRE